MRAVLFFAVVGLIGPACGGSSKKDSATPQGGASAGTGGGMDSSGQRPEDMNPSGYDDTDMADAPADEGGGPVADERGGGGADEGGAPSGPEAGAAPEPGAPAKIEPPGLDKSPEEVRIAVAGHIQTGNAALRRSDWDAAITAARLALNEDEVSVRAMTLLAHAYFGKAYYDKAEAILDIAAKRPDGPQNPKLHFLLGLVYDKTDRPDKALVAYENAVQAKPDYKAALLNLGAKYIGKARFADAVGVYEKLTGELEDNRAMVWANLGAAYRGRSADVNSDKSARAGFLKKAENAYKRATTADTKYGNAYYNLGLLYLDADPFPAPDGTDMDTLKRLERAKTYFNEYRGMPGADQKLVDEQITVVEKLYDREVKVREKRAKAEEKRRKREEAKRKREAAKGGGGDE